MRIVTRATTFLSAVLLALAFGCAKPPTIEITDAENAVNSAEQAGALEYATDNFQAAKEALSDAKTKVEAKDYKNALASALDAKAKAEAAQAAVESGKAAAKAEAQAGIDAIGKEITALGATVKKAKGAVAKELASAQSALESDWTKVQEDFLAANFTRVNSSLKAVTARVDELKAKAEAAAKPAPKAKGSKKK